MIDHHASISALPTSASALPTSISALPTSISALPTSISGQPTSISGLIDRWHSIGAFAADVGCGYEAARQMRRRERIAPQHWAHVVAACSHHGRGSPAHGVARASSA
ncbi:hypothetical protein, partial [Mesorhizobium sp.]|uniref:hypothetical protein n=1 Tax=Mesorhizobium sp. TaxID=1871066 RepID=UPI0025C67C58